VGLCDLASGYRIQRAEADKVAPTNQTVEKSQFTHLPDEGFFELNGCFREPMRPSIIIWRRIAVCESKP
jgi:hypothetical protein